MIINRLTLHNVGVYRGIHSITLTPTADQPIVLIGALNGSGKTTFLEALQLALYGRSARHLLRGLRSYDEYLKLLINRAVNPRDGASVLVEFTHRDAGRSISYRVKRTWAMHGGRIKEDLYVERDGVNDVDAGDRWNEFVNHLLPVQIADLFLFDGERIEQLADGEKSAEVLRTGIHALLGLDVVDSLDRSLVVLDRRIRRAAASDNDRQAISKLESDLETLENRRRDIFLRRGSIQNSVDLAHRVLQRAQDELRAAGGDLAKGRETLNERIASARSNVEDVESELRELAASSTPLCLIPDLVREACALSRSAAESKHFAYAQRVIAAEQPALADHLAESGLTTPQIVAALQAIDIGIGNRARALNENPWMAIFAQADEASTDNDFDELRRGLGAALVLHSKSVEALDALEGQLAATPAVESINHLIQEVAVSEARLAALTEELESLRREEELATQQLERIQSTLNALIGTQSENNRVLLHAQKARATLSVFRERVARKKLSTIEQYIVSNFTALLHKQQLVEKVAIDPSTFELSLFGRGGETLSGIQLSAGERQLMATSILWSLAQASERQLPVVVDTPLARLDGDHKKLLVENYFPKASHQVILLSTDEEVRGKFYRRLEPYISHRYTISYSDKDRSSSFREGYFDVEDAA